MTFSATQIRAFRSCPRKWGLLWLAKVPKAPSPALAFGIDLHRSIATYLTDRAHWTVPPESTLGQLTQDMARCVSLTGELVEIEVDPDDGSRDRWVAGKGRTDWHVVIGGERVVVKPDVTIMHEGVIRIVDWKTTSATEARSPWVLSSRRLWAGAAPPPGNHLLVDDEQARIYALGAFDRFGIGSVVLQWVYGSKRARGAHHPTWSVIESVGADETHEFIDREIAPSVRMMAILRAAGIDPLLLPHDGTACEFTGKFCDALAYCQLRETNGPSLADFRRHLPVL